MTAATLQLVRSPLTVDDLIGIPWDDYLNALDQQDDYDPLLCARLTKAMRLAPSIVVYNALLEGQPVPVSALDPTWAPRYGL